MAAQFLSTEDGIKQIPAPNGYPAKSITETIINGFFEVNRKWTVTYWNKAAEDLLGVLARDIVGKNIWREFAGIIPVDFYVVYHKAFQQDSPVHFEEYWGELGTWFDVITYHCDDTLSVSFKSSNKSVHPEHPKNRTQQLQIINELYRFVTEVTNDSLWEWDLRTSEFFWIDGGHKRTFGYNVENALIPQSFWESCLHPDDKKRVLDRLHETIDKGSGHIWIEEYRFKKANGTYAYVHDRGHIIYDDDKKITRMIGATQDITARKETEIQLLESERKLSLIARQTVNAVVITDASEHIIWVNSAFTRITGYKPEEVMGKKPGFLQGQDTDPLTVDYLRKQMKDSLPFDCDILNYNKSGHAYWVHLQGQALFDEEGKRDRYFAIQTDVTEKKLLQNKLTLERITRQKEITEAVLTAQQNERADIGKELHDNLNQILGATKLYIEMARKDEENRELCLQKSSEYIVNVIEEIRKISKNLATPGMVMGLFDNIKILLDDLGIINPIKIDFHHEGIDEDELNDKLQLNIFRIVQEQLNNILKHAAATSATIDLSRNKDEIILLITDNGKGFDTDQKRKGVGIRNIMGRAELCQGRAEIKSQPGKGFQLRVALRHPCPDVTMTLLD